MQTYDFEIYLPAFLIIGISTFFFRAVFLFNLPAILNNIMLKKGLDSIPSSLLVALVIPYTFFIDKEFLPFRLEVYVILITIPIVLFINKPALSLPIALILLLGLTYLI